MGTAIGWLIVAGAAAFARWGEPPWSLLVLHYGSAWLCGASLANAINAWNERPR